MPRPSPKSNVANGVSVGGIALECSKLTVGYRLSGDGSSLELPARSDLEFADQDLDYALSPRSKAPGLFQPAACDCRNQNMRRDASLPHWMIKFR